jgi:hypothetical protein
MLVNLTFVRQNEQNSVVLSDETQKKEITYKGLLCWFQQMKQLTIMEQKKNSNQQSACH